MVCNSSRATGMLLIHKAATRHTGMAMAIRVQEWIALQLDFKVTTFAFERSRFRRYFCHGDVNIAQCTLWQRMNDDEASR